MASARAAAEIAPQFWGVVNHLETGRQASAGVGNSPLHAFKLILVAELADCALFTLLRMKVWSLVRIHYHLPKTRVDLFFVLGYQHV